MTGYDDIKFGMQSHYIVRKMQHVEDNSGICRIFKVLTIVELLEANS